jgi:hypothetical protein
MNILFRKPLFTGKRLAFLAMALITLTLNGLQSCIMEDLGDCSEYDVVVKMVDADGTAISGMDTAGVYLFSPDGFERMIATGRNSGYIIHLVSNGTLNFGFDKDIPLTLVAWGNLHRDSLTVTTLTKGQGMQEAMVGLRKFGAYDELSTDLFYSRCNTDDTAALVTASTMTAAKTRSALETESAFARKDTIVLTMKRILGAMKVTCRSMDAHFGASTDSFSLVVHSTTNALDFLADPAGEASVFCPGLFRNTDGDYITPVFNLLPSLADEPITIDLYRGAQLLYTGNTDSEGNKLQAMANKQLNVIIDFGEAGSPVTVSVTLTPWGDTTQDVDL